MTLSKQIIDKLSRKVNRDIELSCGSRLSYNRIHKNKKSYDRKRDKKFSWQD